MHAVEINQSKRSKEKFLLLGSVTHCGRMKEMNDPFEINPLTHTQSYLLYCVWRCVSVCTYGYRQLMHKLAILVFAPCRQSPNVCTVSGLFSRSHP